MRITVLFATHIKRKSGYLLAFKVKYKGIFDKATINSFKNILDKLKLSYTAYNAKVFSK